MRGLAIGILLAACGATSGVAGLVVGAVRGAGEAVADPEGGDSTRAEPSAGEGVRDVPRLAAAPARTAGGSRRRDATPEASECGIGAGARAAPAPSGASGAASPTEEEKPPLAGVESRELPAPDVGPETWLGRFRQDERTAAAGEGACRRYDVRRLLAEAPDAPDAPRTFRDWGDALRMIRLLEDLEPAPGDERTLLPWGHEGTQIQLRAEHVLTVSEIALAERTLSVWAARGGEAIPIDVEIHARGEGPTPLLRLALPESGTAVELPGGGDAPWDGPPSATLHLDVPYDHRVRAFTGASAGYLRDYEVSGSMVMTDLTAVVGVADVGAAACATLGAVPEGGVQWIELEVSWTHDLAFRPLSTEPAMGAVAPPSLSLECAHLAVSRFQGRLSTAPGRRWLVALSGGAAALVTVGARVAGPALEPAWARVVLDARGQEVLEDGRAAPREPPADRLRVGWTPASRAQLPGGLDVSIGDGPPVVARADRAEPLRLEPSPDPAGVAEAPCLGAEDLTALAGGVQVTVSRLPAEDGIRSFDVVFDVGARDDRLWRSVVVSTSTEAPAGTAVLRLPTTRRTSVPLRLRLRPGETATRTVFLDVTGRAEPWTLTFERR